MMQVVRSGKGALTDTEAEEAVKVGGAQRLVNNRSDYLQYSLGVV